MNPMRVGGGNVVDAVPLHNTFTSINGDLAPNTSPVAISHPEDFGHDNQQLPSQQVRLLSLQQLTAGLVQRIRGLGA